jgi:hypothetical protein
MNRPAPPTGFRQGRRWLWHSRSFSQVTTVSRFQRHFFSGLLFAACLTLDAFVERIDRACRKV